MIILKNGIKINLKMSKQVNDTIKCRIFKGELFNDGKDIRFLDRQTKQIDKGYIDYFNQNEFEKLIKTHAKLLGMSIDAYDENENLFWSNYREVETKDEFSILKKEYEQLSGEKAKGTWGVKKLTEEIEKLK